MRKRKKRTFEDDPRFARSLQRIWNKILHNHNPAPRTVLLAGSISGEGATTVAANLAMFVAANSPGRVLLVDGDTKTPGIFNFFDIREPGGLTDFLSGERPLDEAVHPTGVSNLFLLGKGREEFQLSPNGLEAKIDRLLEEARKTFDFVFFDSPPVLEIPGTAAVAGRFDGALLIIQADRTIMSDVEKAFHEITALGGKVIGSILNRKKRYLPGKMHRGYFGHDI
ncbi:MAG: CpsD/CapB family tyrosine-protein kinase [Desulfobacterales bacterium]|nr:CpsD/CapB family tyrosine-protein kinase [Desulfobacterales bacterium]